MVDLIVFNSGNELPELPWITEMKTAISEALKLQPTITVHRSKLFSLFDDLRSLLKEFTPHHNTSLMNTII